MEKGKFSFMVLWYYNTVTRKRTIIESRLGFFVSLFSLLSLYELTVSVIQTGFGNGSTNFTHSLKRIEKEIHCFLLGRV